LKGKNGEEREKSTDDKVDAGEDCVVLDGLGDCSET